MNFVGSRIERQTLLSPNCLFTTQMAFPKSFNFSNSVSGPMCLSYNHPLFTLMPSGHGKKRASFFGWLSLRLKGTLPTGQKGGFHWATGQLGQSQAGKGLQADSFDSHCEYLRCEMLQRCGRDPRPLCLSQKGQDRVC